MNSIKSVTEIYNDTEEIHRYIHEEFIREVNTYRILREHRDWVEGKVFGFGERSFHWMWKLIVDEMPDNFSFLEIGVFRGQVISLIKLLAKEANKRCNVTGITPLDTSGGMWESNYLEDIQLIHRNFGLDAPEIIPTRSDNVLTINEIHKRKYDILYIDGGHETEDIKNDFTNYSNVVKPGGYLVIDDCANAFRMPFGYFHGIEAVSQYVDSVLPPKTENDKWEHLFSVVHNRVWKRL